MHKLLLITLLCILLLPIWNGCDYFSPTNPLSSQFDIEVTNIWSTESFLIAEVTINPKPTYNGTTPIYLTLFSKDGHYFGKAGAYTWTPQQLQLPDSSVRDVNIINSMEKQRIRKVQLHIPISDKDAVAYLTDSKAYITNITMEENKWTIDHFGEAILGATPIPDKFSDESKMKEKIKIFSRYFNLKIATLEEAMELEKTEPMPIPTQTIQPTKPSLSLISPNGGEVWHVGDKVAIRWSSTNYTGNIRIHLSHDSGKTWGEIIPSSANMGSLEWIVTGEVSSHCRIRIFGEGNNPTLIPDPVTSAADFTISAQ